LLAVANCGNGDGTDPGDNNNGTSGLTLEEVVTGLSAPVFLTHAGDSRLFIVQQGGRIRIVENGQLLGTPFLDISNIVLHQGEQGLLSSHPSIETAPSVTRTVTIPSWEAGIVSSNWALSRTRDKPSLDPAIASAATVMVLIMVPPGHDGGGGGHAIHLVEDRTGL